MDDWIARHRASWRAKAGLRRYYEHEIFRPLAEAVEGAGPLLEIGTGPGFLRAYLNGRGLSVVSVDIERGADADVTCDVHALPFGDGTFGAVAGVDSLHHFARPAAALNEVARVLCPGGRLALVEPWAGVLGRLFYRYVHHEACFRPADPLNDAFPSGKSAMDGNAMIPKAVLCDGREAFAVAVPALRLIRATPFAGLSYLMTGGFQQWGFPAGVVTALATLESYLPTSLMRLTGLRALFVLEKAS